MAFENIQVTEPMSIDRLKKIAYGGYGNMVKAVADIEKKLLVLGHKMHYEGEEYLLDLGSAQEHLWGFNIYPDNEQSQWIEYDSMINIRPTDGNRSRTVEDKDIQDKIVEIVFGLIK